MRELTRSALVPYSTAQMFALVDDIARYPEFLPWISAAAELERSQTERVGRLTIARAGISEQITTRNIVAPPSTLTMQLVEGPLKSMIGTWSFEAIADAGGIAQGTRVKLHVRLEFKNRFTELLLSRVIETSCDALVDAFARRARQLYG